MLLAKSITANFIMALERSLELVDAKIARNVSVGFSQNIFMPMCIPYILHDVVVLPPWVRDLPIPMLSTLLAKEVTHGYWRSLRAPCSDPLLIASMNVIEDRVSALAFYRLKPELFESMITTVFERAAKEEFTHRLELLLYAVTLPSKLWRHVCNTFLPHYLIDGVSFLKTILLRSEGSEVFNEGGYRKVVERVYKAFKTLELDEVWRSIIVDFESRLGNVVSKGISVIKLHDEEPRSIFVVSPDELSNVFVNPQLTSKSIAKTAGIAKVVRNLRGSRTTLSSLRNALVILEKVCGKLHPVFRTLEEGDYVSGSAVVGVSMREGGKVVKKTLSRPPTQWLDYKFLEGKSCKHVIVLDTSGSMKLVIDDAISIALGLLTYSDIIGFIAFNADIVDYIKPAHGSKVIKDLVSKLMVIEADGGTNFKPVVELVDIEPNVWSGEVLTIISDFDMYKAKVEKASWKYINLVLVEETYTVTALERTTSFISEVLNNRFEKARMWLYNHDYGELELVKEISK
jgi:hypothetical protein